MRRKAISAISHCAMVSVPMVLIGCRTPVAVNQSSAVAVYPQLPEADIVLNIPGLGPCNDSTNRAFRLNSKEPVTVLVHGCFGSAGRFLALSDVLAFHGQQSICFSYDDRDSLMRTSKQLSDAIETLASRLESPEITIIGHSLGGLVARKALVSERDDSVETQAKLNLVTLSAPFSGVRAARFSAFPLVRIATLGLNDLLARILVGEKWYEITYASDFIGEPGTLVPSVDRYLLVATDEEGSVKEVDERGKCIKDDYVFSLEEQKLPFVSGGAPAKVVTVQAGHVEIAGTSGQTPHKLIAVLQREGFIKKTDTARIAEFNALLAHLYGANDQNLPTLQR